MIFIILIFDNVRDILLQHFSRSWLQLPSEKCEVSSLGLELPGLGLGLGLGFYDKVSVSVKVSSRNLSQVSVSEVTVSTTSLIKTNIYINGGTRPTLIFWFMTISFRDIFLQNRFVSAVIFLSFFICLQQVFAFICSRFLLVN